MTENLDANTVDPKFGRYSTLVSQMKSYLQKNVELIECSCQGAADIPENAHKWTKDDLRTLAKSEFGFVTFNGLTVLAGKGMELNKEGTALTADAKFALNGLYEFKPDNVSVLQFIKDIAEVQKETAAVRSKNLKLLNERVKKDPEILRQYKIDPLQLKTVYDSHKIEELHIDGIKPSIKESRIFDQQSALAALDAHKVTLDTDNSLKSPDVKARALDFVKAAKGIAA